MMSSRNSHTEARLAPPPPAPLITAAADNKTTHPVGTNHPTPNLSNDEQVETLGATSPTPTELRAGISPFTADTPREGDGSKDNSGGRVE
jgi:hypothetical protein